MFVLPVLSSASTRDTANRILDEQAFISIVRQYHPVIRAAALQVRRAEAGIQQARGAFDPNLHADLDQKTFDGKLYFSYFNPEISIPTWYGLELLAGTEDVSGLRVGPEATLGALSYTGAKLNISGITMDARRAALRQAQALRNQTLAERRLRVNELLYDAFGAYYEWQRDYAVLAIINEALSNARERMRFVRIEYEQGARPAMDTTEALAQLLAIEAQHSAAAGEYTAASFELSNYLWLEGGGPLPDAVALTPAGLPALRERPSLQALLDDALANHPKLGSLAAKLDALDFERRLKATYLAPKLSVKGVSLSKGYSVANDLGSTYLNNNNKIAAELRLPLFLREARGAYTATRLKIEETRLEQDAAGLAIENKIRTAYNDALALERQVQASAAALDAYRRVYAGERMKFDAGESTLFLLNSRQNKVIEAAQKLAELRAKRQKAEVAVLAAAGVLE